MHASNPSPNGRLERSPRLRAWNPSTRSLKAFSLVEVSLALGIVAFSLVALCGLLSTGLNVAGKAKTELYASQLASSILAERRAAPLATFAATHPLPPLDAGTDELIKVALDRAGNVTTAAKSFYSLYYRITPQSEGVARVYLALVQPAQQEPVAYSSIPKGNEWYETITYIRYE